MLFDGKIMLEDLNSFNRIDSLVKINQFVRRIRYV